MELETKRALTALVRLCIAASTTNEYSDFYENSTVEDDYLFIADLILKETQI